MRQLGAWPLIGLALCAVGFAALAVLALRLASSGDSTDIAPVLKWIVKGAAAVIIAIGVAWVLWPVEKRRRRHR